MNLDIGYKGRRYNPDNREGADDQKLNLASEYNLVYASLFINPGNYGEINEENIENILKLMPGASNSKAYASGNRKVPIDIQREYGENIRCMPPLLLKARYDFFKTLICNSDNLQVTRETLENMIKNSYNIIEDDKKTLLNLECNDIFHQVFKNEIDNQNELDLITILKYWHIVYLTLPKKAITII
jgi:hypothetical protein